MTIRFRAFLLTALISASAMPASAADSDYAKTRYPIVISPSGGAFTNIGPLYSFHRIPQDLHRHGATVFLPKLASINTPEVRGEQLLEYVDEVLAISGAEKVNLVGHSLGALTVRYVAAVAPEKVASVSTIGSLTLGSPVGDWAQDVFKLPIIGAPVQRIAEAVGNLMGYLFGFLEGTKFPQDAHKLFIGLSSAGAADYNARFPQGVPETRCAEGAYVVKGIPYYSWGGAKVFTHVLDPFDYLVSVTGLFFRGVDDGKSDGLVGRCSSHLGKVIRDDYRMNHLDEVNQVLGLRDPYTDPVSIYRQHANRLKLEGL
jgi:triacylglycerol lipase